MDTNRRSQLPTAVGPPSIPLQDREPAYGRAVGRVLAHEVYHILSKTEHHDSSGIAKARYSTRDLMGHIFRFQEREVRKLRAGVAPTLLQLAGFLGRTSPPGVSAFVNNGCVGCHGSHGEATRWGPSLARAAHTYDNAALAARLASTGTVMYRRALELNAVWPALQTEEIGKLTAFLRELAN